MTDSKAEDKHYDFTYKGIKVDPYRLFDLYKIIHPAQQHAIKKLLRAGKSVKSLEQDIEEVIMTLQRWKEMIKEDKPEEGVYAWQSINGCKDFTIKIANIEFPENPKSWDDLSLSKSGGRA